MSATQLETSTTLGQERPIQAPTVEQLRQTQIFRELDEPVLNQLAAMSAMLSVPAGTELCRQGAPANRLLVILDGQISLMNATANGASAVVEVIPAGGHLLLSAVLSGMPYLMSARSVTGAQLIAVDADGLRQLLHKEISLATAMLKAEALDFGAIVRQVCDLKLRTTAQRLGCYLLDLTNDPASNMVNLRLPFDKRLLAARLGCRQENLSRAFAALRGLGVETHGSRVILHDIASLRNYALPDNDADYETAPT